MSESKLPVSILATITSPNSLTLSSRKTVIFFSIIILGVTKIACKLYCTDENTKVSDNLASIINAPSLFVVVNILDVLFIT